MLLTAKEKGEIGMEWEARMFWFDRGVAEFGSGWFCFASVFGFSCEFFGLSYRFSLDFLKWLPLPCAPPPSPLYESHQLSTISVRLLVLHNRHMHTLYSTCQVRARLSKIQLSRTH